MVHWRFILCLALSVRLLSAASADTLMRREGQGQVARQLAPHRPRAKQLAPDKLSARLRSAINGSKLRISTPLHPSIDLVYLYINGSDPEYQRLRSDAWTKLASTKGHKDMTKRDADGHQANAASITTDNGELLFSLRSMSKYFRGKVRKVFVVTETPPMWLSDKVLASGELEVVHPRTIMPPGSYPNFNSRALESNLHNIPGLGDYYMTLNDDVFLGQPLNFDDLLSQGTLKVHMDWHSSYDIEADHKTNQLDKFWNSHRSAMKNANRLLDQRFGHRKHRHTVSHSPLFWSRALVRDAHSIFQESFDSTSTHIFRSMLDVHPAFLYSHYMLENRSIMAKMENSHELMMVFPLNNSVAGFCDMVQGVKIVPRYFSVNNFMSPAHEEHMKGWIRSGLHALFPDPSKYEDVSLHHLDEPPPPKFCQKRLLERLAMELAATEQSVVNRTG